MTAACTSSGGALENMSFFGEFNEDELRFKIEETQETTLELDFFVCGDEQQCADFWFVGFLSKGDDYMVVGPEHGTIEGIEVRYPKIKCKFTLDGERVRGRGEFLEDSEELWLDIAIKVPVLGFFALGGVSLQRMEAATDEMGPE